MGAGAVLALRRSEKAATEHRMPGRWYYRLGASEYGPVTLERLTEMARSGQLGPADWVRDGDAGAWRPLQNAPELSAALATPRPAAPKAPPARRPSSVAPPPPV